MPEYVHPQQARLNELSAQIAKLVEEYYTLVAPTDEEIQDLADMYLDMSSKELRDLAMDDQYAVASEVLANREIEAEEPDNA